MATHLVANLGWVDFDLGSSPGWWPKQDGGTSQIKVNRTQVRHQMGHPVYDIRTEGGGWIKTYLKFADYGSFL